MYSFLNQLFLVSRSVMYVLHYVDSLIYNYNFSRSLWHIFREAYFLSLVTCIKQVRGAFKF